MYYKLPIKERMELMKSYRKANPDMSYRDMVNDYNTSYEKFQDGGKKKSFNDWYKTVPSNKADTSSYNLRRAYELAPQKDLDNFVKDPNAHLYSTYENKETGIYEFMKSKNHPTIQKELEWFNSNDPEAIKFRKNYKLDTSKDYYQYVPQQHKYGGIQKFGNGGKKERDPIYVTDKNDPRLRAYSDSLSTYTLSKKAEKLFDKDFLDPKLQEYNQKADKAAKRSNIKPVTIKTSNSEFSAKGFDPGGMQEVWMAKFKKPVQPYVYKKPEEVLPQVTPQIVPQIPTQNIKPVVQDTVKYQPVIDNGLTRRWNFNTSNPTLEYYDKSGKLIKSEYYKNMNDFKQGKQINYK